MDLIQIQKHLFDQKLKYTQAQKFTFYVHSRKITKMFVVMLDTLVHKSAALLQGGIQSQIVDF